MKSKSILLLLGHFSPYDSEATQFNRVPIIIIEVPASFTNFQTDREHKRLPALTVARGEHVARASSPLLPGAWLQGSRKISKYPRICAVIEESSPALNKPRQAQAEPASGSSSCAHHPAPGRGTQLSSPRPPKSARPRRVGRWRPGHLKRERARWRKARRGGRCQPAPASGRGRCRRRGHVEGGGARCPRPRRGALEGDRASSAVGPVRPPRGPGRASRCPRPGLRGHRHPPGAPRPCSAGPKPGRAGGPVRKQTETAERSPRCPARAASPREEGRRHPRRVPAAGKGGVPGLDLSSPTLPAGRAPRSHAARGLRRRETASSAGSRHPAAVNARRPGAPPPLTAPPSSGAAGHWGAWVRRGARGRGRQAGVGLAEGPGAGFPHPPSRVRGTKTRTCVRSTELRGGAQPPARCAPPISRGFHAALRLGRDAFGVGADARAGAAPKIPLPLSAAGKGIPSHYPAPNHLRSHSDRPGRDLGIFGRQAAAGLPLQVFLPRGLLQDREANRPRRPTLTTLSGLRAMHL